MTSSCWRFFWAAALALLEVANTLSALSKSSFFQRCITLTCIPYSEAISPMWRSSFRASKTICNFCSGNHCFFLHRMCSFHFSVYFEIGVAYPLQNRVAFPGTIIQCRAKQNGPDELTRQIDDICRAIQNAPFESTEYSDSVVRQLIDTT